MCLTHAAADKNPRRVMFWSVMQYLIMIDIAAAYQEFFEYKRYGLIYTLIRSFIQCIPAWYRSARVLSRRSPRAPHESALVPGG